MESHGITFNFSLANINFNIAINFSLITINFGGGQTVSVRVPLIEDAIKTILQVWKARQAKKPTTELEEKIKALELAEKCYKSQVKQLHEVDPDMIVDGVDVVFNRELTEEERDLLNSKEVTEKKLTDLVSEYDPDCRWTDAEWKYDRFTNNFDEEGIDARTAIIFGYAVNDLFEALHIPNLYVKQVEVDKSMSGEAAAEYLRQWMKEQGYKK